MDLIAKLYGDDSSDDDVNHGEKEKDDKEGESDDDDVNNHVESLTSNKKRERKNDEDGDDMMHVESGNAEDDDGDNDQLDAYERESKRAKGASEISYKPFSSALDLFSSTKTTSAAPSVSAPASDYPMHDVAGNGLYNTEYGDSSSNSNSKSSSNQAKKNTKFVPLQVKRPGVVNKSTEDIPSYTDSSGSR